MKIINISKWIKSLFYCEWILVNKSNLTYQIKCSKAYTELSPYHVKYCPWCGRKVCEQ